MDEIQDEILSFVIMSKFLHWRPTTHNSHSAFNLNDGKLFLLFCQFLLLLSIWRVRPIQLEKFTMNVRNKKVSIIRKSQHVIPTRKIICDVDKKEEKLFFKWDLQKNYQKCFELYKIFQLKETFLRSWACMMEKKSSINIIQVSWNFHLKLFYLSWAKTYSHLLICSYMCTPPIILIVKFYDNSTNFKHFYCISKTK